MKKKALEDDIFNAVLEQAFTEAVAEEFADVPAVEVQSQVPPKKKHTKRKWIICTGLLIAAAGAVLLFLLMNAGPDGYSIETPEYVFGYIPDEYVITEYRDLGKIKYKLESKMDNSYFTITYYGINDIKISVDNEHSEMTTYSINGNTTYVFQYPDELDISLIWNDEKYLFKLYGNLEKETLLKIAENIICKPQ